MKFLKNIKFLPESKYLYTTCEPHDNTKLKGEISKDHYNYHRLWKLWGSLNILINAFCTILHPYKLFELERVFGFQYLYSSYLLEYESYSERTRQESMFEFHLCTVIGLCCQRKSIPVEHIWFKSNTGA